MSNPDFDKKSVKTNNGEIFDFSNLKFKERPTVVFLHGLSSNHTTWINLMEILDENNYNSLALDMRGHGFSDKTKNKNLYKFDVFSNDLKAVLEKEGIGKFVLVGYSFGGQIAIDFAARYPGFITGLVLISVNQENQRPMNAFESIFGRS